MDLPLILTDSTDRPAAHRKLALPRRGSQTAGRPVRVVLWKTMERNKHPHTMPMVMPHVAASTPSLG